MRRGGKERGGPISAYSKIPYFSLRRGKEEEEKEEKENVDSREEIKKQQTDYIKIEDMREKVTFPFIESKKGKKKGE